MAFDFDVRWHSQMVAEVDALMAGVGARVPVSVRNLRFDPHPNPNPNPNPDPDPDPDSNPNPNPRCARAASRSASF